MKKEITKFVGRKIKQFRKNNKLTQRELGDMVGVKNNTISAYEHGTNEPDQDILFKLADIFNVSINDFFPDTNNQKDNELERALKMTTKNLNIKDIEFLNQLIEKTLSLEGHEREKFLESIKFTVDYYKKMNED